MKTGILLAAALALASPLASATERSQNDGYALLYGLTEKERKCDLIFLVKDASDPIHATTKKIARAYARIGDDLKQWAGEDKSISLKATRLPPVEVQARDIIDRDHQKQLLEGTKGKEFEHLFMIVQWQALWYGYSLTQALIDREESPARKRALREHAKTLRALIDEAYAKT